MVLIFNSGIAWLFNLRMAKLPILAGSHAGLANLVVRQG